MDKGIKIEISGDKTAQLYLYGVISEYGDIQSKAVQKTLADIDAKTINVHINSKGGDVFESIAIMNLLKDFKADIHVFIDGLAASGASIIAMAGDKISMNTGSMMAIHNAWTFMAGNAAELRKAAEDLDKISGSVKKCYMGRFVGEESELTNLLDAETWLSPEEAKAFGFCDEILGEEKKEAKACLLAKYAPNVQCKALPDTGAQTKEEVLTSIIKKFNKKTEEK